jgi:hypothetical protein
MVQVVKTDLLLFYNLEEVPEGGLGNAKLRGELLIGDAVISGNGYKITTGMCVSDC